MDTSALQNPSRRRAAILLALVGAAGLEIPHDASIIVIEQIESQP